MHEQSETRGTDAGYINTYGGGVPKREGQPLPPIFGFERSSYQSLDEAVRAAILRSILSDAAGTRNSGSDFLRTNPPTDILRQLMILMQIQQSGMGKTGP